MVARVLRSVIRLNVRQPSHHAVLKLLDFQRRLYENESHSVRRAHTSLRAGVQHSFTATNAGGQDDFRRV